MVLVLLCIFVLFLIVCRFIGCDLLCVWALLVIVVRFCVVLRYVLGVFLFVYVFVYY